MDNFTDEDIDLFCFDYKKHILSNPLLNSKIPVWVEYLKTKQHYRQNGMEEDYFFKKRFRINDEDLITIHKLIDRIKRGKTLTKQSNSNIRGTSQTFGSNIYSTFDETIDYQNEKPKFELMNEIAPALDAYNRKMKKHQKRHKWKNETNQRIWENPGRYSNNNFDENSDGLDDYKSKFTTQFPNKFHPMGCVQDEPDRYYTEDLYSTRPQIEFDVQDFARTQMYNMNKTNIIQQLDKMNDILDSNNLITNDFDTEYKRSVPVINSKKKVSFENKIDYCIGNNELTNKNRSEWKFGNGMINGLEQGLGGPMHYAGSPEATRLWQDVDLLANRGNTRNTGVKNRNPFEHQFDYLDGNYNRVPDPRIVGTSSRIDNRSTFTPFDI